MDSNDKKLSLVDPLPPSNLSVALMICPGVQANSVHACNAGNANACLNRALESCAWLVGWPCLSPWNIPWNIRSGAMAVGLCSTLTLWNIALMHTIG